jgi:hypothetical protein
MLPLCLIERHTTNTDGGTHLTILFFPNWHIQNLRNLFLTFSSFIFSFNYKLGIILYTIPKHTMLWYTHHTIAT